MPPAPTTVYLLQRALTDSVFIVVQRCSVWLYLLKVHRVHRRRLGCGEGIVSGVVEGVGAGLAVVEWGGGSHSVWPVGVDVGGQPFSAGRLSECDQSTQ